MEAALRSLPIDFGSVSIRLTSGPLSPSFWGFFVLLCSPHGFHSVPLSLPWSCHETWGLENHRLALFPPFRSIVVEPVIVRKDVVINRFSFVVAHRYTKPISGIGMGAQKYNAEVKVSRADVDLGLVQLSDKLRHVRQVRNYFPVRGQSWPATELLTESLLAARYFFRLASFYIFITQPE